MKKTLYVYFCPQIYSKKSMQTVGMLVIFGLMSCVKNMDAHKVSYNNECALSIQVQPEVIEADSQQHSNKKKSPTKTETEPSLVGSEQCVVKNVLPRKAQVHEVQTDKIAQVEVWMNVFVHGINVQPDITVNNFIHFVTDTVDDTLYAVSVDCIRQDSFFYQHQVMLDVGLVPVDPRACGSDLGASQAAYVFDQISAYCQDKKIKNLFYTFGWHGLMSPSGRYESGVEMFKALECEVARLNKVGIYPKLRVIGYSHGGNVCLNLGAAHYYEFPNSSLVVDQLYLLGTPIQPNVDYLINDPIFKKVYNIFSAQDRVQRLDFFSCNQVFSRKTFRRRSSFTLPDKLVQIQFKVVRSRKSNYSQDVIAQGKNFHAHGVVSGNSTLLRNISPGHGELWALGWISPYRPHYPFYPIPSFCFIPFIDKYMQDVETKPKKIILFDIRPDHEMILITEKSGLKIRKVIPFLSAQEFADLKEYMVQCKPATFTDEAYKDHVSKAVTKAKELYENKIYQVAHQKYSRRAWRDQCKECKRQYQLSERIP